MAFIPFESLTPAYPGLNLAHAKGGVASHFLLRFPKDPGWTEALGRYGVKDSRSEDVTHIPVFGGLCEVDGECEPLAEVIEDGYCAVWPCDHNDARARSHGQAEKSKLLGIDADKGNSEEGDGLLARVIKKIGPSPTDLDGWFWNTAPVALRGAVAAPLDKPVRFLGGNGALYEEVYKRCGSIGQGALRGAQLLTEITAGLSGKIPLEVAFDLAFENDIHFGELPGYGIDSHGGRGGFYDQWAGGKRWQYGNFRRLGDMIRAFRNSAAWHAGQVLLYQSDFGRRPRPAANDEHGQGGLTTVIGKYVNGLAGPYDGMWGEWAGIGLDKQVENGLRVTSDTRSIQWTSLHATTPLSKQQVRECFQTEDDFPYIEGLFSQMVGDRPGQNPTPPTMPPAPTPDPEPLPRAAIKQEIDEIAARLRVLSDQIA